MSDTFSVCTVFLLYVYATSILTRSSNKSDFTYISYKISRLIRFLQENGCLKSQSFYPCFKSRTSRFLCIIDYVSQSMIADSLDFYYAGLMLFKLLHWTWWHFIIFLRSNPLIMKLTQLSSLNFFWIALCCRKYQKTKTLRHARIYRT